MVIPLKYSFRSLTVRWVGSLMTLIGMALVVAVFCLLLAMANGLSRTLMQTAEEDHVVVMSSGAVAEANSAIRHDQFNALRVLPEIKQDETGAPLASPELLAQLMLPKKEGGKATLLIRGITPVAFAVHRPVHLISGRAFYPGQDEVIIGEAASLRFVGLGLRDRVRFGQREWTVVGIFKSGTAFDSEIWADLNSLMGDYKRETFSSATLTVVHPDRIPALTRQIAEEAAIALHAQSEIDYYREQAQWADQIKRLGLIVAFFMAIGAVLGAMITMYAEVAHRATEIGILRAIGFSKQAVLLAFITESLLLSLGGGVLGSLAILPFNGFSTGIMNMRSFSETGFAFYVTPSILFAGILFSAVMGIIGGFLPARQASRLSIIQAVRGG